MNSGLFFLTSFFILMSLLISIHRYLVSKNVRYLIINAVILTLYFIVLYKYFYVTEMPIPKEGRTNSGTPLLTMGLCFVVMIAGMICNVLHFHYRLPKGERDKVRIDWGGMIVPFSVSPLVFIPIATLLHSANIDLANASIADIMSLCVAFQNGFFWKDIFDNRKKRK